MYKNFPKPNPTMLFFAETFQKIAIPHVLVKKKNYSGHKRCSNTNFY